MSITHYVQNTIFYVHSYPPGLNPNLTFTCLRIDFNLPNKHPLGKLVLFSKFGLEMKREKWKTREKGKEKYERLQAM